MLCQVGDYLLLNGRGVRRDLQLEVGLTSSMKVEVWYALNIRVDRTCVSRGRKVLVWFYKGGLSFSKGDLRMLLESGRLFFIQPGLGRVLICHPPG